MRSACSSTRSGLCPRRVQRQARGLPVLLGGVRSRTQLLQQQLHRLQGLRRPARLRIRLGTDRLVRQRRRRRRRVRRALGVAIERRGARGRRLAQRFEVGAQRAARARQRGLIAPLERCGLAPGRCARALEARSVARTRSATAAPASARRPCSARAAPPPRARRGAPPPRRRPIPQRARPSPPSRATGASRRRPDARFSRVRAHVRRGAVGDDRWRGGDLLRHLLNLSRRALLAHRGGFEDGLGRQR